LEESIAFIILVAEIDDLKKTLAVTRNFLRSFLRLLVTTNFLAISPILVTLMMEAMLSSEASVLTRTTESHILEDDILHSHRRENFKFYIVSPLGGQQVNAICRFVTMVY
jgi:hypothetical protein